MPLLAWMKFICSLKIYCRAGDNSGRELLSPTVNICQIDPARCNNLYYLVVDKLLIEYLVNTTSQLTSVFVSRRKTCALNQAEAASKV
jgi:hypothetical protein